MNHGETIASDPEFHQLMLKAGKLLHISEHTVHSGSDEKHTICSPIECKGIVGTDGRKYILDLIRTTPRDANYPEQKHTMYILRPELIFAFCEYKKEKALKEEERNRSNATPEQQQQQLINSKEEAQSSTTQPTSSTTTTTTEEKKTGFFSREFFFLKLKREKNQ
jgi:protein TIF31